MISFLDRNGKSEITGGENGQAGISETRYFFKFVSPRCGCRDDSNTSLQAADREKTVK